MATPAEMWYRVPKDSFDIIDVVYLDSDTIVLKVHRKNLFSKHVGWTKQSNVLWLFMEGCMKIQVDFDQVRTDPYGNLEQLVNYTQAACLMEKHNPEIWVSPGIILINASYEAWQKCESVDLRTRCFSFKSVRAFFCVFSLRKRLTIQEALSHPWITVRLNKETDLAFYHEQSRDHGLAHWWETVL